VFHFVCSKCFLTQICQSLQANQNELVPVVNDGFQAQLFKRGFQVVFFSGLCFVWPMDDASFLAKKITTLNYVVPTLVPCCGHCLHSYLLEFAEGLYVRLCAAANPLI